MKDIKFETIDGTLCRMVEQPCPHCGQPEIIATPVVEGSKEWALYQMMQGEMVVSNNGTVYWQDKDDSDLIKYTDGYGQVWVQTPILFLKCVGVSGWQIYIPEPKYKVGDWVRTEMGFSQVKVTEIKPDGSYWSGDYKLDNIIRKLNPSEVRVKITMEGTVSQDKILYGASCFTLKTGRSEHIISLHEIEEDELVESILKAQEVENG